MNLDMQFLHSTHIDWLERLQWPLSRFSDLGITADICVMGLIDLWGLYCLLSRLGGEV